MALAGVTVAAESRPYSAYTGQLKEDLVLAYSFDTAGSADYINTGLTVDGNFTVSDLAGTCTGSAPVTITGLNLDSGFTFSFQLVGATGMNPSGGAAYVALYSDASKSGRDDCFYINGNNRSNFGLGDMAWGDDNAAWNWAYDNQLSQADAVGSVFTLTWDAASKTATFYVDGESVASFASGSGALEKITFATAAGQNNGGSVTYDNIALWERTFTADEVKALSVIPEPTTAALSLLALAGLAARRRRK